jgi:hypothetical protein
VFTARLERRGIGRGREFGRRYAARLQAHQVRGVPVAPAMRRSAHRG